VVAETGDYAPRAERAFNARDVKALEALWNESFLYSGPGGQTTTTNAEGIARERAIWTSSSDVRVALTQFAVMGDRLVLEGQMSGTHDGPMDAAGRTIPPTGKRFEVAFAALFTMKAGRAAQERVYYDRLSLLEQIGLA
jgi:ketosteroid isomerase-like protein